MTQNTKTISPLRQRMNGAFSLPLQPYINNSGTVAFSASLDAGGSGPVCQPDPIHPLFGIT
jgi:hypothetical protein